MTEELGKATIEHLKAKIHVLEKRNTNLANMTREAEIEANLYTTLYHKLMAEVSNTFSQHSLNPQLLYAYMEAAENAARLFLTAEE